MAEREGFEPSIGLSLYTLSRGALSAAQPSLRVCYKRCLTPVLHLCRSARTRSCFTYELMLFARPTSCGEQGDLNHPPVHGCTASASSVETAFSRSVQAISTDAYCISINLAEGVGFEPTVGFPTPVFKTGTFGQLCHPSKCAQSDAIQMRSIKRGVI